MNKVSVFGGRWYVFLALLGPLLGACGAPGPDPVAATAPDKAPPGRPNVILVCIDTLRADHLGAYGYGRPTSPRMDQFAREGWLFETAIAPSSYTRETIASLFLAQYPSRTAHSSGWSAAPPAGASVVPGWFRESGYHTALFSNTPMLENLTFYEQFATAECLMSGFGVSGKDRALSDRALEYVAGLDEQPFFLYLHYLDPHGPYDPALPYLQRMGGPRVDNPLALYESVRGELPDRLAEGFGPEDPRFQDLVDRYDAEIAVVDEAFGALLDGLEAAGLAENTIIVLFADHGEEFLEHGFVEHAWRVYRESVHVPLIMRYPAALEARRVEGLVSLVDVGPTVARLAGLSEIPEQLDGVPLLRAHEAAWVPAPRPLPVMTELAIHTRNVVRAFYDADYVYMAAQKWLSAPECSAVALNHRNLVRAFEQGETTPVLNSAPFVWEGLFRNPGPQLENLLEAEAEVAERYRAQMTAYLAACPEPLPEAARIAERDSGADAALLESQLEALGYFSPGE